MFRFFLVHPIAYLLEQKQQNIILNCFVELSKQFAQKQTEIVVFRVTKSFADTCLVVNNAWLASMTKFLVLKLLEIKFLLVFCKPSKITTINCSALVLTVPRYFFHLPEN